MAKKRTDFEPMTGDVVLVSEPGTGIVLDLRELPQKCQVVGQPVEVDQRAGGMFCPRLQSALTNLYAGALA